MKKSMKNNEIVCGLVEEVISDVRDAETLGEEYEEVSASREPMVYVFCAEHNDGFFEVANNWCRHENRIRVIYMREYCRKMCGIKPKEPAAVTSKEKYGGLFF